MSDDEKIISMVLLGVTALAGIGALVWWVIVQVNSAVQAFTSIVPN